MDHSPLAPHGAFVKEKKHFRALKRHLREARSLRELYQAYLTIEGIWDRPMIVMENQCGKVMQNDYYGGSNTRAFDYEDYQRIAQEVAWVVLKVDALMQEELDAKVGGQVPQRPVTWALRKWLVPRDTPGTGPGDAAKRRAEHKRKAEQAATLLFERYKNTEGARELFQEARLRSANRHDMCDALLMGIFYLLKLYAIHAQEVLGRRRPHEERPDCPVLTPAQMNGGTLRALVIDSGSTNMGLCFLELVGMVAPPDGRPGVTAGLDSAPDCADPEPKFRILALELIDLKRPWSETRGQAVVTYSRSVAEAPVMEPDYFTDAKPLTSYFPTVLSKKRPRKDLGDAEEKGKKPRKKKQKVEPAPAVSPNIVLEIQD
jgi:hypothetical protein